MRRLPVSIPTDHAKMAKRLDSRRRAALLHLLSEYVALHHPRTYNRLMLAARKITEVEHLAEIKATTGPTNAN